MQVVGDAETELSDETLQNNLANTDDITFKHKRPLMVSLYTISSLYPFVMYVITHVQLRRPSIIAKETLAMVLTVFHCSSGFICELTFSTSGSGIVSGSRTCRAMAKITSAPKNTFEADIHPGACADSSL